MTDLMQAIYTYIEESRSQEYLPRKYYFHYQRVREAASQALHDSLSAGQWDLLEQYLDTQANCNRLEREAIFQAAWAAARELR